MPIEALGLLIELLYYTLSLVNILSPIGLKTPIEALGPLIGLGLLIRRTRYLLSFILSHNKKLKLIAYCRY
jgi:hypothetical protein